MQPSLARSSALIRRLAADRSGNILMLTGLAILLLTMAIGMGIDYSRAQRLETKLNAAADAAALAAVDPSMLNKTDAQAQLAAQQMFDQQVAGLSGLTVTSRVVTISDNSSGSLGSLRTVTVTYTGTSANSFAGILRVPTLPISGSATASASQPPSMNFYIAMDTSPSMLLPTTSTGITNLTAGAIWSGEKVYYGQIDGCDFACHATSMQQWNRGTYVIDANKYAIYLNSAGTDFYRVNCTAVAATSSTAAIAANSLMNSSGTVIGTNVQIRTATNNSSGSAGGSASNTYCTTYTSSTAAPAANPIYIYYLPSGQTNKTSNYTSVQASFPDTYWLAQNYSTVNPGASNITLRTDAEQQAAGGVITYAYGVEQQYANAVVPPVYQMQFYTFNQAGSTAAMTTAPFGTMTDVATLQNYTFPSMSSLVPNMASALVSNAYTSFTTMLTSMQSTMPSTAGAGTKASPQNVLIIITDGMVDDSTGIAQFANSNITQCTAIKATGARIAILYTQYLPNTINYTGNTTFNNIAANNVPYIQSQLQSCASQNADGTYLMQTVSTDGSVTTALNTLFAMVVQSARLVQ
jgi:Flp pilus assembly protein TadG